MRNVPPIRLLSASILLLVLTSAPTAQATKQQTESLRGLFVKTRPGNQQAQEKAPSTDRLALGYTMFLRDSSGQPARIDAAHRFAEGEGMRLVVEPNSDGYLYIFDREGDGPMQMIFPDLRLRSGDARLAAHVALQIPDGSTDKDWFAFTGPPQAEKLIVVFSREPVTGWPRGRELLQYPRGFQLMWERFAEKVSPAMKKNVEQAGDDTGKPLSTGERASLSRGLKLLREDPPPSVIEAGDVKSNSLVVEIPLKRQ
ncbi:MAG TPA: DUF4384 domain-containing protein [Blastocatellia bacterium]|nr:DUF4384 domain-containing protein [Blastocatellia bacterium]